MQEIPTGNKVVALDHMLLTFFQKNVSRNSESEDCILSPVGNVYLM